MDGSVNDTGFALADATNMDRTIKHIALWLAAAAVGGTLFLAPVVSAATTTQTAPGSDSGSCASSGQVFGQEGGDGCTVPNGTNSSGSNLPYDDAGNNYEHAGAV
jgi:hypothetical protein